MKNYKILKTILNDGNESFAYYETYVSKNKGKCVSYLKKNYGNIIRKDSNIYEKRYSDKFTYSFKIEESDSFSIKDELIDSIVNELKKDKEQLNFLNKYVFDFDFSFSYSDLDDDLQLGIYDELYNDFYESLSYGELINIQNLSDYEKNKIIDNLEYDVNYIMDYLKDILSFNDYQKLENSLSLYNEKGKKEKINDMIFKYFDKIEETDLFYDDIWIFKDEKTSDYIAELIDDEIYYNLKGKNLKEYIKNLLKDDFDEIEILRDKNKYFDDLSDYLNEEYNVYSLKELLICLYNDLEYNYNVLSLTDNDNDEFDNFEDFEEYLNEKYDYYKLDLKNNLIIFKDGTSKKFKYF